MTTEPVPGNPPPPPPPPQHPATELICTQISLHILHVPGKYLTAFHFRNAQVMHENALQKSKGQNNFQIDSKNGFKKILQCL
jgi:hypothetical protein